MTAENDADREAFEAYRKSEYLYSDKANPDAILLATLWNGFMAGAAHARAQAGEPVAWVNESYRNEILQRSGKVYWHAPMMCGQEFKGSFPVYLAATAQEPVAVPEGWKLAWVPDYPEGDVIGPCICGSWPGGKCLRCPVQNPPASPISTPAESGEVVQQTQMDRDIGILLATLDWIAEATGEGPEGEDAAMVAQIRADHEARRALSPTPQDADHGK